MGQRGVAFTLTHYVRFVMHKWKKSQLGGLNPDIPKSEYLDDFFRHYLKALSAHSFEKTFRCGPGWMLLTHLHALTAKAPFSTQQIVDDVTAWVSENKPSGELKQLDMTQMNRTLDSIFSTWYTGEADGHLSFRDYCNDFTRWATSGGAPRVELFGSKYRTKWAWAYAHATHQDGTLKREYDLYAEAMKTGDVAMVALKEEAQKTREIITTPLPSYLRQCYLLYRWGKPKLPSPISSDKWLPSFEAAGATWYGCVDGDRFDQTIPGAVILGIIDRLGRLDNECKNIAEAEIASLEQLELTWGGRKWRWNGGLLSGWRMTSLFGTLVSAAAAEYIIARSGKNGIRYGVMGDDIVLYSHVETLDTREMVDAYIQFGLDANPKKTVSGVVGEYLRKVRSKRGTWGFPALGLRSLMYANPWIEKYKYDREVELSNTWLTYMSRLIPHSARVGNMIHFIYSSIIDDLTSNFGKNKWADWMLTPISAGGGGCIEVSDITRWHKITYLRELGDMKKTMHIPYLLGILKRRAVVVPQTRIIPIELMGAGEKYAQMISEMQGRPESFVKHSVSKTRLIFDIMAGGLTISAINSQLTYPLPRSMRIAGPSNIVEYIMSGTKNYSGITTVLHTKEAVSRITHGYDYYVRDFSRSKKNNNLRNIQAAITVFVMTKLKKMAVPYGTW